ncbi:MAG: hypothetical protein IPL78_21205 [Chloroflexi bacterium]|nr:hypothetical protein [Chloroflexota bacterium]
MKVETAKTYQVTYLVDGQKQMMRVQGQDEAAATAAATYAINAIHVGASYTQISEVKELPVNTGISPQR